MVKSAPALSIRAAVARTNTPCTTQDDSQSEIAS
jgi:hypothetical protein